MIGRDVSGFFYVMTKAQWDKLQSLWLSFRENDKVKFLDASILNKDEEVFDWEYHDKDNQT